MTIAELRIAALNAEHAFLNVLTQHGIDAPETSAAFRALTIADARYLAGSRTQRDAIANVA